MNARVQLLRGVSDDRCRTRATPRQDRRPKSPRGGYKARRGQAPLSPCNVLQKSHCPREYTDSTNESRVRPACCKMGRSRTGRRQVLSCPKASTGGLIISRGDGCMAQRDLWRTAQHALTYGVKNEHSTSLVLGVPFCSAARGPESDAGEVTDSPLVTLSDTTRSAGRDSPGY